jgi:hypothetical protein
VSDDVVATYLIPDDLDAGLIERLQRIFAAAQLDGKHRINFRVSGDMSRAQSVLSQFTDIERVYFDDGYVERGAPIA